MTCVRKKSKINLLLFYFDQVFVGILYRETKADMLPMSLGYGRVLQIIVEHHGRNNFEMYQNEFKGIIGDVWLNHEKIENWNHTQFPFEDQSKLNEFLQQSERDVNVLKRIENQSIERLLYGPVIFGARFDINSDELFDTYIDTSGWGKVGCFYLSFSCPIVQNDELTFSYSNRDS